MAKKVLFSKPKQTTLPPPETAEQWVNGSPAEGPMKRLTIDVPLTLHNRVKSQCASRGVKMADEIRALLEKQYPA